MTDKPFKLTESERHSVAWMKISAHLTERLEIARTKNDGNLDADATAKLRGQIAAYKQVLSLGVDDIPELVAKYDE